MLLSSFRPIGRLAVFVSLLALVGFAQPSQAQTDEVPAVTRTFALEGARIVQAPGRVIERGTVVVRDGLIVAVGPNVAVPFDAERIEADSLVVYAGFIDGLSHAGIPEPRQDNNRPDVERPGDPPNDVAGIQPDRRASLLLKPGDNSISRLREAGFAAAHVVPHGEMLPGQGALILLSDAETAAALVLRDQTSLYAEFDGAPGVYPATPMGILAKFRQLYREAERRQRIEALYAEDARGLTRPDFDPVHAAFYPVIDGTRPVFFLTETPLEAHRALALHRELGFPLVIAGLTRALDAADAIEAAGAPVFLSLALPEEKKDTAADADSMKVGTDTTKAVTPDAPGSYFVSDLRTRAYEDIEREADNLRARRAQSRADWIATPARLRARGLRFGFSTRDVKPGDLTDNLRLLVEAGLSEDDALAALTTDAAALLGVERSLGTVEVGKIANLVVTTGPYFEEDTQVRYVFVDGERYEYDAERAAPQGDPNAVVAAAGAWLYTVETPQGNYSGTLTLTGAGSDLEGTISTAALPGEPLEIEDADLDGNLLTFAFEAPQFGRVRVTATIEGDAMEGTMEIGEFGGFPMTATRTPGR